MKNTGSDIMIKMLNHVLKGLVIVCISLVIWPLGSFAQGINTAYSLPNELGVEINPVYPKPHQSVSISLTMYTEDLDSATISWYKDGKQVLSGKGEVKYSFSAGGAGEASKIEIKVALSSGASFSKSFTINPASVDLVWEADSYVPPFYKGKALHPRQGILKIVAMPEFVKGGKRISSQNLIYKWSNGMDTYQSQSGYGKNVLVLSGSILGKSEKVEVTVTDPVSNLSANGYVNISPVDPQIVFYENNPYYGHIFDTAISNVFKLKAEEVQIMAAPYFFTKEGKDGLEYTWRLNNQTASNLKGSRTAIFRKPENEGGKSSVLLRMENTERILQQAEKSLIMDFND